MYSKRICGMFCSCVQKYDLISVRCRVDTGRGAATTGHCHRRVPGPCAASSHHTGPVLTITIDHYSPIEISEILKSLLDPARARDNDAALCCCVIGREIPHPAAAILQLSWAELVFSFLVLRNVRRLPTKYEVAWKPSINTTISHRYWITLEIFVHSRKNIGTASGEWMEAM